jgi:hypothetical protein
MHIYIDNHNCLRMSGDEFPIMVPAYFESDVQGSPEHCDLLLREIDLVASAKKGVFEGTGNAHTITISPDGVALENVWDESLPKASLTLTQFRNLVTAWKDAIENIRRDRAPH